MRSTDGLDSALLARLGQRLARERVRQNLTQATLASEAGVSRATLQRLESGDSTQLVNLIRILRALGLLENLDALVPAPATSPLENAAREGRRRQRASPAPSDAAADATAGGKPWTWGEDR